MDRTNSIIAVIGCFFVGLFFMSIFVPGNSPRQESSYSHRSVIAEAENDRDDDDDDDDDDDENEEDEDEEEGEENNRSGNLNPGQKMEQQIQREQRKYYRSLQQDESAYYKQAAPQRNDDPDYFMHSHPLEEHPLQENRLR